MIPPIPGISTGGGSLDLGSSAASGDNYGSPIIIGNTAPNFGAIVQPFLQPPENGGMGLKVSAPGFTGKPVEVLQGAPAAITALGDSNVMLYGIAGILGIGALIIYARKR